MGISNLGEKRSKCGVDRALIHGVANLIANFDDQIFRFSLVLPTIELTPLERQNDQNKTSCLISAKRAYFFLIFWLSTVSRQMRPSGIFERRFFGSVWRVWFWDTKHFDFLE
ncbi:MAG TPA: hypothetical protein DDW24_06085 [Blastocatellia bacterium]|nr:hypothetical protein [Blastocatellia bacterium]